MASIWDFTEVLFIRIILNKLHTHINIILNLNKFKTLLQTVLIYIKDIFFYSIYTSNHTLLSIYIYVYIIHPRSVPAQQKSAHIECVEYSYNRIPHVIRSPVVSAKCQR